MPAKWEYLHQRCMKGSKGLDRSDGVEEVPEPLSATSPCVKGLTPNGIVMHMEDIFPNDEATEKLKLLMQSSTLPSTDAASFYTGPGLKQMILHYYR